MTERSHTTDAQPAKRQKVDVACDLCRSKKIKCDSVRPVCGPCLKRKNNAPSCSWEGSVFRNQQPSRAELFRLRRRIEELESNAASKGDQSRKTPHSDPYQNQTTDIPIQVEREIQQDGVGGLNADLVGTGRQSEHCSQNQNPANIISPALTQRSMRTSSVTDGASTQATEASIGTSSINSDFYGGSSVVSFLSQIRNAAHQKLGFGDPTRPTGGEDLQTHILGATAPQRLKPLHYVLPGRRQADKLLSLYWDTVHPLCPFLEKRQFLAQYEALWVHQETDTEDPVFLCTLNLLFAISSHLNGDLSPTERHSSADVFFGRSKEYLDVWNLQTLQSVQMLLLMSIYTQSLCELNQSWMITGVAIRTAQSLGLHLHDTGRTVGPHENRGLLRRVWHSCVFLDRMAAMTYGRPSMTPASITTKCHISQFVDEDIYSTDDLQAMPSLYSPSGVGFFLLSSQLFEILNEVLEAFYSDQHEIASSNGDLLSSLLGRTTVDNKWFIMEIDKKLLEWEERVPRQLRVKEVSLGSSNSSTIIRQATILRQQYLHTRLLLMRPILSAYLSAEGVSSSGGTSIRSPLTGKIAEQCSVACVKTAQEMINIAYSERPRDPNLVGMTEAWWNNVLFIYSAATVLIAARLSPSIMSEIPEQSILQSWSRANDVLKAFQVFTPKIQRLVEALEIIHQIIPEQYCRSRLQTQQNEMHSEQSQTIPTQPQQGPQCQDLLNAAQAADMQTMSTLAEFSGDEMLDNDLLFGINNFAWLTAMPFEI
ncbi:fungal-specific transcription factor domain-containing protein [Paraphoma chrysanthemicola]|uniref:Fungal-specific transcription factor domain-containing protein n=1 Tax=Paraphoma chrysanthemicola TaxID=798071 RepID=A0A8K0R313_9PLEO|nr:fungal-specific transcription factor domain-containing protein [Paraphoma chrysanthemicola]